MNIDECECPAPDRLEDKTKSVTFIEFPKNILVCLNKVESNSRNEIIVKKHIQCNQIITLEAADGEDITKKVRVQNFDDN